ncbi:MAG: 1-deoxy-D-xylulose-5-phosphate reductoisomerase [Candidatus Aegiribacteria sp.]
MGRRVAVLGSTGSIGTQALEIIDGAEQLQLHSLLCGSSVDLLSRQSRTYSPNVTAVVNPRGECPSWMVSGPGALREAVEGADVVLNAIVGSAGLEASLLCRELDLSLALANKESLVVGGELLEDFVRRGRIIPVDSEHSTIFRCLLGEDRPVLGITLTASGGSVRDLPLEELREAPASRILSHPTWDMGARITVDSATMVNKAFEVMEARWLFGDLPVEVAVHPQSIVHSLVKLPDGSWKALLGEPDMKVPIQYALLYPDGELMRLSHDGPPDWGVLEFRKVDPERYPAFHTVMEAGKAGGTLPAAANAADEVAVEAFLQGRIGFGHIPVVIEEVLNGHDKSPVSDFHSVMEADSGARAMAGRVVDGLC